MKFELIAAINVRTVDPSANDINGLAAVVNLLLYDDHVPAWWSKKSMDNINRSPYGEC